MKLNDKEKRIFLAAMEREKKECAKVDMTFRGEQEYEDTLVSVCNSIKYKVMRSDLWKDCD